MSLRARVIVFVAVVAVVATAATAYAVRDARRFQERSNRPPKAAQAPITAIPDGPRIAFRHTGLDSRYGTVALVSADEPGGARAFTGATCDRVDATVDGASCLRTERGVVFEADQLSPDWTVVDTHRLPGIPSRTRMSEDASLVATTSFVSGHSYMTQGFSTVTDVREVGGRDHGNLEKFQLVIDGREVSPSDRNVWGVTFRDDRSFFATVGTGGSTYLVAGDLDRRTLTTVTENAECPSLSPDGNRVAFKVDVAPGDQKVWQLAVMDLATGRRTELSGSPRGIDDQVEWLDDDTLLYGLPRDGEAGVTDVWSLDVGRETRPTLLIADAWSPTVIRDEPRGNNS